MINKITILIVMMIVSISAYGSHLGSVFSEVSERLHNQEKFLHYLAATNVYQDKCGVLSFNGVALKSDGVKIHSLDLERLRDYDNYNEGYRVSWVFCQFKECKGIYERFKKFGLETTLISPYHQSLSESKHTYEQDQ